MSRTLSDGKSSQNLENKPSKETVGGVIEHLENKEELSTMEVISLNALKRDVESDVIELDDSMREATEKKEGGA